MYNDFLIIIIKVNKIVFFLNFKITNYKILYIIKT